MKNSNSLVRNFLIVSLVVFCFVFTSSAAFAQKDEKLREDKMEMKDKSLYQRLGGYDALAAVTDDFVGRLVTDKKIGRFFVGFSVDSQKKIRQHVIDFLCLATGGPCAYTGRDMKLVHTGIGVTEDDWNSSVKHLTATLDKFKVPEKEKGEVLAAVGGLKKDIVEKK